MKYTLIFVIGFFAVSCGMKVPYTNQVREDFSLDTNKQLKKVQFYTSATIILEKSKSSQNQETSGDGALRDFRWSVRPVLENRSSLGPGQSGVNRAYPF